jgi:flavin reductase (DIM6/NTAB) family NADH-FMN oxidoreductase RutF
VKVVAAAHSRARLQPVAETPAVGLEAFRETFSRIPAAVSVVTTMNGDGAAHGTTVSAFSSLSVEPPLVLVALDHSSDLLRYIRASGRFGMNILGVGQERLGQVCARKGVDKLADVVWRLDDGLPRINDSAGWLACDVYDFLPGGDHEIVLGLVTACEAEESNPLLYHRRRFAGLTS